MKILYITRHFNHSGYLILDRLVKEKFNISGVVLKDEFSFYKVPYIRHLFVLLYELKCKYYRCLPLKAINSEELLARKSGIKILKTKSIKSDSFFEKLEKINPDLIVLGGGWPELIPKRVFLMPRLGCINTHPSLLPNFRGTSITRWQILNKVKKSGVTIHFVDDKFDTGGVLSQEAIDIDEDVTPQEMFFKLGELGAKMMPPLLRKFEKSGNQDILKIEKDQGHGDYYKKWKWSVDGLSIDWELDFSSIHFFVLANTQESYEYLGPNFEFAGRKYFLRSTRLHPANEFAHNIQKSNIGKYDIFTIKKAEGSIFLYREEERFILELKQIQLFDKFYKLRRAKKASNLISLEQGDVFKKI